MSEYIIDVGEAYIRHGLERTLAIPVRINENEDNWMDTRIPVTSYAAPDLEPVRKEAYEKGFNDGVILESNNNNAFNNGYHQGLINAWGTANKIISLYNNLGNPAVFKFFDQPVIEAMEKLEAYERDNKIKVGNEVMDDKGDIGICTEISYPANSMHILYSDGTATDISLTGVTKTGNDFPEVVDLLKKMRGE